MKKPFFTTSTAVSESPTISSGVNKMKPITEITLFYNICNLDDTILRAWYHLSWPAITLFFVHYMVLI